jgi:NAD(P)-dependent dehydrogenase (short-subunit alcohol dehydrogenase family)
VRQLPARSRRGRKLANEIGALAVPADVSSEADVVRLFKTVDDKLGRLTALVNNAGIVDVRARVENMSLERLQRMFAVNVIGSFLCAREAIKRMSKRHGGAGGVIVNLSSGRRAPRLSGRLRRLCLGEGGDRHFHHWPCEGSGRRRHPRQRGRPGVIRTEIHATSGDPGRLERIGATAPLARPGEPDEVAQAVLWVASDEASYTTGAIVDVTGGR